MKYMTVKEYAKSEGICLAAAYKRVDNNDPRIRVNRKFGRILIKVNPTDERA